MAIEVKCVKCGKSFKLAYVFKWKYSEWCDHCIQRDQPREVFDREDAEYEFKESSKQAYEQRDYEPLY
jgi:transcription elongation factor Elf1